MKRIVLCAAFLAAPVSAQDQAELAPPSCDYGKPHASAPKELSQFDFLIGDFTIAGRVWTEDGWGPVLASSRPRLVGRYTLDGRAIYDEWYDNDPGLDPETTRGLTVRMYDEEAEEWKVAWMSTKRTQITDLRVKLQDGVLTMRTEHPAKPNYDAYFERTGPDSWTRTAFRTEPDGSRRLLWQAMATRIPCAD